MTAWVDRREHDGMVGARYATVNGTPCTAARLVDAPLNAAELGWSTSAMRPTASWFFLREHIDIFCSTLQIPFHHNQGIPQQQQQLLSWREVSHFIYAETPNACYNLCGKQ